MSSGNASASDPRAVRSVLAALWPFFAALPLGFLLSALLVHTALMAKGLEPWNLDPTAVLAAFGPLEISLSGLGNQLVFFAVVAPSLISAVRRPALLGDERRVSLSAGGWVLAALSMYALSSALSVIVNLMGLEHEGTLGQLNDVMARLGLAARMSMLPVLALAAGFSEELLFRGYLFRRLALVVSPGPVIVFSAAAFGLAHLDPIHSAAAFVMGLYLGWLRLRTRSVWPGVVAHVFSNATVIMTHAWLDDLGDVPLSGAIATGLVFAASFHALRSRINAGCTPQPRSTVDPS